MGEAKRRKAQGLPPKVKKDESRSLREGILVKYPRLPLYLGVVFGVYLIFDLIRFNTPH